MSSQVCILTAHQQALVLASKCKVQARDRRAERGEEGKEWGGDGQGGVDQGQEGGIISGNSILSYPYSGQNA